MRYTDFMTAKVAILAGAVMLAVGCNQSPLVVDKGKPSGDEELASQETDQTSEERKASLPELDENAVNEDGLIVLHDPSADDSAVVDSVSQAGNTGDGASDPPTLHTDGPASTQQPPRVLLLRLHDRDGQ